MNRFHFLVLVGISFSRVAMCQDKSYPDIDEVRSKSTSADSSCVEQDQDGYKTCYYYTGFSDKPYKIQRFKDGKLKIIDVKAEEESPVANGLYLPTTQSGMALMSIEWAPSIPTGPFGFRLALALDRDGHKGGGYAHLYFSPVPKDDNVYKHLSKNPFGDEVKGRVVNKTVIAGGIVWPVTRWFAGTLGSGVYIRQDYKELYDNSGILGENGKYYIEDGGSKAYPMLEFGGLVMAKMIVIGVSADIPMGVTLTLGWNFIGDSF